MSETTTNVCPTCKHAKAPYKNRKVCKRCYNEAGTAKRQAKRDASIIARVAAIADGLCTDPHADPDDVSTVEQLIAKGSIASAASALGLSTECLRSRLREIEHGAARRGVSPTDDASGTAPIGFHVKGKSTHYGADGEVIQTWVKTQADQESKLERLMAAVKAGMSAIQPAKFVQAERRDRVDDLLAVYPMGDPHLGMLAWARETGNAFDLKIAERNLFAAVDHLVNLAPPTKEALLINLGDFFHADGKGGMTTGGTRVDVDSRWPKVLDTGIAVMCRLIERCLEKHERVTVICEIGNHDDHSSIMLALCLSHHFRNEPRVTIDTSPQAFHYYRFGKVLIGTHHGDKTKRDILGEIMATDMRRAWGESEFCYWYIGHVHHTSVTERPGVVIESFRTLAAKDDWHTRNGYRAGRSMCCVVHHRDRGEVDRHTVGIGYLETLGAN